MDVSRCPSGVGCDASASASAPDGLATRTGDTNGLLRDKLAALREVNLSLRIENSDLKVANGSLAQEKQAILADLKVANGSLAEEKQALLAALAEQMSENQRSLGLDDDPEGSQRPPPALSGGPTLGSMLERFFTVRASRGHGRSR